MGLFNKLKNALFEEEEIEIESAPAKVEIKKEEPIPVKEKKEETKKEKIAIENERDLFKAENTFNFPDFDEEEFVTNYEPPKPKEEKKPTKKVETRKTKVENLYTEPKVKVTQEKTSRRRREKSIVKKEEVIKKSFHPSPIISPVYGVLNKDYTKEDIIPSKKMDLKKKLDDVDSIRKKAFGTLEEDIEKTLNEPLNNFYNEDTRSIDELLNDSIDDAIDINRDMEDTFEMVYDEPRRRNEDYKPKKRSNRPKPIEEDLEPIDENLEMIDEELPTNIDYEEKDKLEDTLESDLFDLIDSMYDDREEE